jgi:hypothetical protein
MSDGFNLNHGESVFGPEPVRLTPGQWYSIFILAREEIAKRLGKEADILVYTFTKDDGQTVLRIEPVALEHGDLHTDRGAYEES